MLGENDLRIFNDSLDRCLADERFLDLFYDRLVRSSPEVAEKFASTDMRRQKRMLKSSLYSAMLAANGNPPALEHLRQLEGLHRERGIGAELYDRWLDCLLEAVHACDPSADERVEATWRRVLAVAIDVMKPS